MEHVTEETLCLMFEESARSLSKLVDQLSVIAGTLSATRTHDEVRRHVECVASISGALLPVLISQASKFEVSVQVKSPPSSIPCAVCCQYDDRHTSWCAEFVWSQSGAVAP